MEDMYGKFIQITEHVDLDLSENPHSCGDPEYSRYCTHQDCLGVAAKLLGEYLRGSKDE